MTYISMDYTVTLVDDVIVIEDTSTEETTYPLGSQIGAIVRELYASGDYDFMSLKGFLLLDLDGLYDKLIVNHETGEFVGWSLTNKPTVESCFN